MKSLLPKTVLVARLAAMPALAQTTGSQPSGSTASPRPGASSSMKSGADAKFVQPAVRGGMAEVELGQLAQQYAQSLDVKALAHQVENQMAANGSSGAGTQGGRATR